METIISVEPAVPNGSVDWVPLLVELMHHIRVPASARLALMCRSMRQAHNKRMDELLRTVNDYLLGHVGAKKGWSVSLELKEKKSIVFTEMTPSLSILKIIPIYYMNASKRILTFHPDTETTGRVIDVFYGTRHESKSQYTNSIIRFLEMALYHYSREHRKVPI